MNPQLTTTHLINVDEELEATVIGSVLAEPNLIHDFLRLLPKSNSFAIPKHQYLHAAFQSIYHSGEIVDIYAVNNYLRIHKLQDKLPIWELVDLTSKGVPGNFEQKCRILFELALRRYLYKYGQKLSANVLDQSVDPLTFLSRIQDDLTQIVGQLSTQSEKGPQDYILEVLADIEASQKGKASGLTTGIPILDQRTGGFEPGNLVILAARPAVGKSAFLLHWLLHHTLELEQPAGIFTLEMKGKEIMRRAIAHQTGYSNFQLQQGKAVNLDVVHERLGSLPSIPLQIRDLSIQLPELIATAREWHRRHGITLLAVDYIQLVRDSRYAKAYDRVSEVSNSLKSLAQDTGMVVVGLSQLSRACEARSGWDRRPQQSDLRESGNLEQDANNILMLFSPYLNNLSYEDGSSDENTLEIHAPKLRNGKPTNTGADPGDNGPLVVTYDKAVNRILPENTSLVSF